MNYISHFCPASPQVDAPLPAAKNNWEAVTALMSVSHASMQTCICVTMHISSENTSQINNSPSKK